MRKEEGGQGPGLSTSTGTCSSLLIPSVSSVSSCTENVPEKAEAEGTEGFF